MNGKRRDPFASVKATAVNFDWQAVATALVKQADLHEGLWRLTFHFERIGATVPVAQIGLCPGVIVPCTKVSLVRAEKVDPFTVDAAKVNPASRIIAPFGVN